jgi:hypothetical protein
VGLVVKEEIALAGRHGFLAWFIRIGLIMPEIAVPRDSSFDLSPQPTGRVISCSSPAILKVAASLIF